MSEKESEKLIRCVLKLRKKYHSASFRYIYDTLSPRLYYLCLRYLKDEDDAKDALQESFIIIHQKLNTYNGKGSFEGWAKRIAINFCIKKLKKKIIKVEANELNVSEINEEDTGENLQQKTAVKKALMQLPDGYRTIMNLYVIEEYSHKEISEMLGISEGTSRSQLNRAKVALRNLMQVK